MSNTTLRLGTRGSLLARTQSQFIAAAIEKAQPSVTVELIIIKTTGDQVQDRPLADIGGKGLFTKELELALLQGEVDLAVHSFKDVPVTMPLVDQADLTIACVPNREDARDVLISREGVLEVQSLPANAKVGTGSLRRQCQLLELRPDLRMEGIRGNIDSRLRKLRDGEFDAVVLAMAGLKRTGLFDAATMYLLPVEQVTPAAGQGALALQTRRDDRVTIELVQPLHNQEVARCVEVERQVVLHLNGDCHSPIGAYATIAGDELMLRIAVGKSGGGLPVQRHFRSGVLSGAAELPLQAVQSLINPW